MKMFLYTSLLLMLFTTACNDSQSPTVSDVIDSNPQKDKVITDTKGTEDINNMDTTKLAVDSAVNMTINGTSLQKNNNAVYHALYDNWLSAYTEVHHLPAVLHINYIGTVMMGARGDIMDEVVKAQDNMKQYIAKATYKKPYDSLSAGQQAEMQQQHAILFQKEFR